MKKFEGNVLFLDRKDINTDEIIPAKYLTEITKEALKPFILEDLKLDYFNPKTDIKDTWADISQAKEILNWQPTVSIDEGVKRAVEWYQANKHLLKEITI